jgi:hypothetical protein
MKMKTGFSLAAAAILGGVACSSAHAVRSKANQATFEGGILVNPGSSHIWVLSIDGKEGEAPSHGQYRLTPGRHEIRVQYFWGHSNIHWTGNSLVDYAFDVKKGDSLRIVCQHTEPPILREGESKGTWKFWVEDAATKQPVAADEEQAKIVRPSTGEVQLPDVLLNRQND